ncbi:MAG: hypothetical protein LAT81_13905 [Oceanicaulis sp.]|nr:hypothetical protein [Oceanicaulis sp.]
MTMPILTPEQKRQHAAHLRQESIRLRKSNPELSEMARQHAVFFQKKAEAEEQQIEVPVPIPASSRENS